MGCFPPAPSLLLPRSSPAVDLFTLDSHPLRKVVHVEFSYEVNESINCHDSALWRTIILYVLEL